MLEVPTVRYVAPGVGQTLFLAGDLVVVKATATETAGAYSLFERRIAPGGGLPPHLHRYEDEGTFVLAGTLAVHLQGRTFEAEAGGYVFVPRTVPHAFTNPGPEPTQLLLLVSPGGLRELLLADLGQPVPGSARSDDARHRGAFPPTTAASRSADLARLAAAAEKYGTEFVAARRGEAHDGPPEPPERSTLP